MIIESENYVLRLIRLIRGKTFFIPRLRPLSHILCLAGGAIKKQKDARSVCLVVEHKSFRIGDAGSDLENNFFINQAFQLL